jgi:hypothetical protein
MSDRMLCQHLMDSWWPIATNSSKRWRVASSSGLVLAIETGRAGRRSTSRVLVLVLYDPAVQSRMIRCHKEYSVKIEKDCQDIYTAFLDSMQKLAGTGWSYIWTSQAWWDAIINHFWFSQGNEHFRIVVGSLGFGDDDNIFWDIGNAAWTEFRQFKSDRQVVDAYFWVESDEDTVYDVLRPNVLSAIMLMGLKLKDENFPVLVDGRRRKDLKRDKIHYCPAPPETQKIIMEYVLRCHKAVKPQMELLKEALKRTVDEGHIDRH